MKFGHKAETASYDPSSRPFPYRAALAWIVIFALQYPVLFTLAASNPKWVLGVDLRGHDSRLHSSARHDAVDHEEDYSNVPGAPDHPADHNCTPCQVLKYLVSCLPQSLLLLSPATQYTSRPSDRFAPQRLAHIAALPPVRAPPQVAV